MMRSTVYISVIIYLVTASVAVAEIYTVSCESCDYAESGFMVGANGDGETISPALCPACKELFAVSLKKGDLEGKKKYKCPSCKERLYLYRNNDGDSLTEPEPGAKYRCPGCGAYALVYEKETADDEIGEEEICPDESESME